MGMAAPQANPLDLDLNLDLDLSYLQGRTGLLLKAESSKP
jgi:hypothetical protein